MLFQKVSVIFLPFELKMSVGFLPTPRRKFLVESSTFGRTLGCGVN